MFSQCELGAVAFEASRAVGRVGAFVNDDNGRVFTAVAASANG